MGRPAFATEEDVQARLAQPQPFTGPELAQVRARLDDASEIVRAYAGGTTWLNDTGDALEDAPPQFVGLVANMVARASANPEGVVQESAGPFARSFGADAAQRLYLTQAERLMIRQAGGFSGLYTIATTRGPIETGRDCNAYHGELYPEEVTIPWPES